MLYGVPLTVPTQTLATALLQPGRGAEPAAAPGEAHHLFGLAQGSKSATSPAVATPQLHPRTRRLDAPTHFGIDCATLPREKALQLLY